MATGGYDPASSELVSGYASAALPSTQQYSPPAAYGTSQSYGGHSAYGGQTGGQPTYRAQPDATQATYSQPMYAQQPAQTGHRASGGYDQPNAYLAPGEQGMGHAKRDYTAYTSQVMAESAWSSATAACEQVVVGQCLLVQWPLMTLYMLVMLTRAPPGLMEVLIDRSEARFGMLIRHLLSRRALKHACICTGCCARAVPGIRAV